MKGNMLSDAQSSNTSDDEGAFRRVKAIVAIAAILAILVCSHSKDDDHKTLLGRRFSMPLPYCRGMSGGQRILRAPEIFIQLSPSNSRLDFALGHQHQNYSIIRSMSCFNASSYKSPPTRIYSGQIKLALYGLLSRLIYHNSPFGSERGWWIKLLSSRNREIT